MNFEIMLKNIKLSLVIFTICFSINSLGSEKGAEDFVKQVADKAIEIVKSDKSDDKTKKKDLIKIFDESVDAKWMAKFVSGRNWRDIKDDKRQKYVESYRKYLIQTYVPEFKSYSNESVKYNKSTKEYDDEYLVQTEIVSPNQPSIKVNYKVRQLESGEFKIFDVIAEGISLITTQRSEFGSIISRKGVDHLIKIMDNKSS